MRRLTRHEMFKRGCVDCADVGRNVSGWLQKGCPHEKCPYTVLDKYNTYEEFLASEDSKIITPEFFVTGSPVFNVRLRKKDTRNKCHSD